MFIQLLHNSEQFMINDTFNVVYHYTLLAKNDHPRYLSVIENTSGSFSISYAFILTVWFEYTILVNVLQRFTTSTNTCTPTRYMYVYITYKYVNI